jgi:hypothetical protein
VRHIRGALWARPTKSLAMLPQRPADCMQLIATYAIGKVTRRAQSALGLHVLTERTVEFLGKDMTNAG